MQKQTAVFRELKSVFLYVYGKRNSICMGKMQEQSTNWGKHITEHFVVRAWAITVPEWLAETHPWKWVKMCWIKSPQIQRPQLEFFFISLFFLPVQTNLINVESIPRYSLLPTLCGCEWCCVCWANMTIKGWGHRALRLIRVQSLFY